MKLTTNFRLRKPEGSDPVNVEDFNDNVDVIDAELAKRVEKTGNAGEMVASFSQAATRSNLTPGEKLSVSLGKIAKFFADLKAVAFSGSYTDLSGKPSLGAVATMGVANNCTTTAAGFALDARQGKVLAARNEQISSCLDGCTFERQADGVYITYTPPGGADTVTKKLGDGWWIKPFSYSLVGHQSGSVACNFSDMDGYETKTASDFTIYPASLVGHNTTGWWGGAATFTKSYNAQTGILVVSWSGSITASAPTNGVGISGDGCVVCKI